NEVLVAPKPKSKKKTKKAKFKSLKKEALVPRSMSVKEESSVELMSIDDDLIYDEVITSPDALSPCSTQDKKRKPASDDDEPKIKKKSKKTKAAEVGQVILYPKPASKPQNELKEICDNGVVDLESKQISRSKSRVKLSIPIVPLKQVFIIKPEKLKKKGSIWSKDFSPSPDPWSPREDAVLCAVVQEYGPNWNLASEILYGMIAGGSYRGRFRHPIHCTERFRELIQRYVLSVSDASNNDKSVGVSSGKALLRVTEDNIRVLLSIASEIPDHEPLLQKHFLAVLSASWSSSHKKSNALSFQNGFYKLTSETNHQCSKTPQRLEFTNLHQCGKLVASALSSDSTRQTDIGSSIFNQREEFLVPQERLDLTLEIQGQINDDPPLPPVINLSIPGLDPSPSLKMYAGETRHIKSSHTENQFRHVEGYLGGESQSFTMGGTSQLQHLGKHKLPFAESGKPSKSKQRKTSKDQNSTDQHSVTANEVFRDMPAVQADPGTRFDEFLTCFSDAEFVGNFLLDVDGEVASVGNLETAPFDLGTDLTSELDDFSMLPEFTDIG
ncbi:hypothetical protein MIMGU_mgv1a0000691mg, partial [Erythranthe guttata]